MDVCLGGALRPASEFLSLAGFAAVLKPSAICSRNNGDGWPSGAGKRRVTATATLSYEPAYANARRVESKRSTFTAPLGPIEADDLRWYLEQYFLWPVGVFKTRADGIEKKLPQWGQDLFRAARVDSPGRDDR